MDDTLVRIQKLFTTHKMHHILVVERGKLMGVISDRDYLKSISPFIGTIHGRMEDEYTLNKKAHQIMTRKPVTITPKTTVEAAALLLLKHGGSCLPVASKSGKIEGIVTWRDLLKYYLAIHLKKVSGSAPRS